jgi:exopolyphosphatase/guanosine-5'-triphosphate,3'-diphosphate pyrophosphatase
MSDRDNLAAAVDLGSNSFHMIIGRFEGTSLSIVDKMREPVRLGAGLDDHKNLTKAAQERALDCLRRMGERVKGMPKGRVRAVGTNTLRVAKNGAAFLDKAEKALGHPIDIIAGREEARLIYLGVSQTDPSVGKRLVVDIGGGSTECIIGTGPSIEIADSLFMGCVSYSMRYFPDGRITKQRFEKAKLQAELELETIEQVYKKRGWTAVVGCSGTIHGINRVISANGWSTEGITAKALKKLRKELIEQESADEMDMPGLDEDRKPVIAGGTAILEAVFDGLGIDVMHPSPGALREGLLYETIGRIRHEDVRDRTIRTFMDRYGVDANQAERVFEAAMALLAQVGEAWKLDAEAAKKMLSFAASLHEIGLFVSHTGYHKHSAYLVEHSDMAGFTRLEQSTVAAMILGHRRKLRADALQTIPDRGKETARRLLALFSLASSLCRSRTSELPELFLTASGDRLTMLVPRSWLEQHPLTRADLMGERERLEHVGFDFELQEIAK